MSRYLVAAVLAVCVSYASADASWNQWTLRDECTCDSRGRGFETYQRECWGGGCPQYYEQQQRPCECGVVLSIGEMAGIVVGCVFFLILIICLFVWCCCCCGGEDCGDSGCCGGGGGCMGCMGCGGGCGDGCMGCGGCGRWDSEEDLYRGRGRKVPMMTQMPAQMQAQPQQIIVTAPQMRQQAQCPAVNFGQAVVPQQIPQSATYFVG